MANIDRISGLTFRSYDPSYSQLESDRSNPGKRNKFETNGVETPNFQIEGYTTDASKVQALQEIVDNPDWPVSYIAFPSGETQHDGWYQLCSVQTPRSKRSLGLYPFVVTCRKIGTTSNLRPSVYWESASEAYTGWTSLCAVKAVTLPNDSTCEAFPVMGTRWAAGGYSKVTTSPSKSYMVFTGASALSSHYAGECAVYDSLGSATSSNWQRVFSPAHQFLGDKVYQNGVLRFMSSSGMLSACVWDGVSASTWVYVAHFVMNFDGTGTITHSQVKELTPEHIEWEEIRQSGSDLSHANWILRRGQYAPRVLLKTFTGSMPWYGVQWNTGWGAGGSSFRTMVNQGSQGTSGSGDLPVSTSSASNTDINWCAGYSSSNNWLAGFIYTESPSYLPQDASNAMALALSQGWATNASRIFFPFAVAFNMAAYSNQLGNPGFETSGTGGADVFGSWTEVVGTGSIADTTVAAEKHGGSHAAKLTAGATTNTEIWQSFTVTPGETRQLSFWTRGDATNDGRYSIADNTHSTYIVSPVSTGVPGTTYAVVIRKYMVPVGCLSVTVSLRCASANGGIAYFDDSADIPTIPPVCASLAAQALHLVTQEQTVMERGEYP